MTVEGVNRRDSPEPGEGPGDGEAARSSAVEAILQDYADARDDERYYLAMVATTLTLGVAALSLLGALANQVVNQTPGHEYPDALLAGAPLPIIAILSFIQTAGAQSVLRSFYLRALEREIRARLDLEPKADTKVGARPFTWSEIVVTYTSLSGDRRSAASGFFASMAASVFGILWVVFGGLVVFFALQVSTSWRLTMAAMYVPAALWIFLDAIFVNRRGREIFAEHVELAQERMSDPGGLAPHPRLSRPAGTRTLVGYLALPRPDDLVKVLYSVAGLTGALLAAPRDGGHLPFWWVVAYLVAVEYLAYQSRYQWNDVRGVDEDAASPLSKERGRLPGGRRSVPASLVVMAARLYGMVVIVAIHGPAEDPDLPGLSFDQAVLWAAVAIYAVAVLYEAVRGWVRRRGSCSVPALLVILVLVGLGYPLRFVFAWEAFSTSKGWPDLAVMAFGFWCLGVALVTLTWVLEGAAYIVGCEDDAERVWLTKPAPAGKVHLLRLLEWLGIAIRPLPGELAENVPADRAVDGKSLHLVRLTRWRPVTPWSLGSAAWLVCVAHSGGWLVGLPDVRVSVLAVVVCLVLFAPVPQPYQLLVHAGAAVVVAAALAFQVLAHESTGAALTWMRLICLVALAVIGMLFHLFFWMSSYRDTRASAQRLVAGVALFAVWCWRTFLGWDDASGPVARSSANPPGSTPDDGAALTDVGDVTEVADLPALTDLTAHDTLPEAVPDVHGPKG